MQNEINNMSLMDRLSRNQSMEQMDNILSRDIRTAMNMKENAAGYDKDYYNVSSTEQEVQDIQRLLDSLDLGYLKVGDKELAKSKLSAVQGRNLSHLMLNDQKVTGDSSEMSDVKEAIAQLETVMTRKGNKNPWTPSGKRRKAKVQATLKRLTKEAEAIEVGRIALQKNTDNALKVTNGMELLSFVAVQNFTEKLQSKREQTRKEDLEREKNLLQTSYDADLAEYNDLYAKKKEEYGFMALIRIPFDGELNALKEKLNPEARAQEIENIKNRINDLDTKKKEREENNNGNNADVVNRQNILETSGVEYSLLKHIYNIWYNE
mgnify:CR=1 FL=1